MATPPSLLGNAFFLAIFAILSLSNLVFGPPVSHVHLHRCNVLWLPWRSDWLRRSSPSPFESVLASQLRDADMLPHHFARLHLRRNYLTLKHVTLALGPDHSRLKPKFYTCIFICCDIFTLILQGAGGGIVASAKTDSMQKIGNDLMMAGIVLQVAILLAFAAASADFLLRLRRALKATNATLSPEAYSLLADL